jgi:LysR family hca operon transcriptional activator
MKLAAESRLHTAQPSLSRQMRDLEHEVGAALLTRSVRGVELTAAGRAFLDHAWLALTQAEAAAWLAPATRILSDELPKIEIRVSSGFSVTLAEDLKQGRIDIAFLRHEPDPDLAFELVLKEPLVAILPADHRLAAHKTFDPHDLKGETFTAYPRFTTSCAERSMATSNGRALRSHPVSGSIISPWRYRWLRQSGASRFCRFPSRITCPHPS